MPTEFDWKRFWSLREETVDLSDGGFLSDPDSKWGKYYNPNLVTFEHLAEVLCVALLGEPGIGKSWSLNHYSATLRSSLRNNEKLVYLDLRSFGNEQRLVEELFESADFDAWRKGDGVMHLLLDSLDECLLRIDNVAALLADELPKEPVDRLRLRIACRTVPWPTILENACVRLFKGFKAYEMTPLRRVDVRRAAEQSGIDNPDRFMARIQELDVTSLAIKPVTLKFLISTYLRDGDFPKNHIELYERGCRILCEESNESRAGSGRRGRLSLDERLAIASRIAAVTQLGKRFVGVSLDALREVLDTGLFSSRGANRIGWAHQTYAEFLAAHYCINWKMPIQQIRALLFHPADQARRLVPQLHEVAAWMSAMNPEILGTVADSDPEALLGAAAASLSDTQRAKVVDSMLQQASQGRALHLRWGLVWLYKKLKHPKLAEQIRPYLNDVARPMGARYVAVDIARACKVEGLGPDLADIALDTSADRRLRSAAAAATAEVEDDKVRARLRPLALGQAGPPKNPNLGGTYSSFMYDHVAQKMSAKDIPVALEWFSRQAHRQHLIGPIDRLMDRLIELAWDNVYEAKVAQEYAAAIISRVKLYDELVSGDDRVEFAKKVQNDHARRRAVWKELLPRLEVDQVVGLITSRIPLITGADLDWFIERLVSGNASASARVEARLVRFTFDSNNGAHFEKLYNACQANEILNAECGNFFAAVPLDSAEADQLRDLLRQKKEWKTPKLLDPTPSERVQADLQKIEAGQMAYWLWLTRDLTLEPTSTNYPYDIHLNLAEAPGWKEADAVTREGILRAGMRYIHEGDPENDKWFGTRSTPYSAISGFRALALLMVAGNENLDQISTPAWRKWIPIILTFPFGGTKELDLQSGLLKLAYKLLPEDVIQRIRELIEAKNKSDDHLFLAREVEICWDDRMGKALLAEAKNPELKTHILNSILDVILPRRVEGAREFAESLVDPVLLEAEPERSKAITAAQALMKHTNDAGWGKIWPIFVQSKEIGREIVESASYGDVGHGSFITKLCEPELGELYLWMVENYPYLERKPGFGYMGPGDTAVMLRDSIIEHLKKRGTFAACEAIRSVMEKLPQYTWMNYHLEEAEALARAATWQPVSIGQFLSLAQNREQRFVETGRQLVDLIVESLDRLHSKLHGEVPATRDLWNNRQDKWWPKDEQDFADYLTRHLNEDLKLRGIVVNREVQIRRGIGDGTGQRTDIHVDAVIPGQPGSYERTYVIVEVKGNWNTELLTAMETQLHDRYLRENKCRDGIYLAGWFTCTKWDDTDNRKNQCSPMNLAEAKDFFSQQATALSGGGFQIESYVLDVSLP
ncbi:MAG: hypothetical protein DMG35_20320 [Acidobacteria bacterium]|nr:MAG: hypothetical protein DMG35_20320 [Acidobacteriota bacterium]